jgi:hypothetical protein
MRNQRFRFSPLLWRDNVQPKIGCHSIRKWITDSIPNGLFRVLSALNLLLFGLWWEIEWDGTLPHFRGSPAIVPRSYPTSESLFPHPTNVLLVKHSRLALQTFPLPMKSFSSLSGHLGKGRKVLCLPQFHFDPKSMISFRASIKWKSSSPFLRSPSLPFWENLRITRVLLLLDKRFASWIGTRNDGGRISEVTKSTIPLRIVHSIFIHNPKKRRFRVLQLIPQKKIDFLVMWLV